MSNFFMISVFVTVVAWRYLSHKGLINELSLQYELDKEKHELETYSTQLEALGPRANKRTLHIGEMAQVDLRQRN